MIVHSQGWEQTGKRRFDTSLVGRWGAALSQVRPSTPFTPQLRARLPEQCRHVQI